MVLKGPEREKTGLLRLRPECYTPDKHNVGRTYQGYEVTCPGYMIGVTAQQTDWDTERITYAGVKCEDGLWYTKDKKNKPYLIDSDDKKQADLLCDDGYGICEMTVTHDFPFNELKTRSFPYNIKFKCCEIINVCNGLATYELAEEKTTQHANGTITETLKISKETVSSEKYIYSKTESEGHKVGVGLGGEAGKGALKTRALQEDAEKRALPAALLWQIQP